MWWVGECSEIVVARSEAEARAYLSADQDAESGPVDWDETGSDGEGGTVTLTQAFAEALGTPHHLPAQIWSSYT